MSLLHNNFHIQNTLCVHFRQANTLIFHEIHVNYTLVSVLQTDTESYFKYTCFRYVYIVKWTDNKHFKIKKII